MKVSTDAMLLGSWAQPLPGASSGSMPVRQSASGFGSGSGSAVRVLDVGTGTGVLALMMAQKLAAAAAGGEAAVGEEEAAGRGEQGKEQGKEEGEEGAADGLGRAAAPAGGWQRSPQVVAIDVDEAAVLQARENVGLSPWHDRIRVLHVGLQQLAAAAAALGQPEAAVPEPPLADQQQQAQPQAPVSGAPPPAGSADTTAAALAPEAAAAAAGGAAAAGAGGPAADAITAADVGPFDLIITNPPYFVASSKPARGRDARAAARHADVCLPFPDLAAGCAALLAPGGAVCVVLPPPEAEAFCAAASRCGLVLTELVHVFTAGEDPKPRRHLMRLQRVINGPKRSGSGSSSSMDGGSSSSGSRDGSSSEGEEGAAAAPAPAAASPPPPPSQPPGPGAGPGPARLLTAQYAALTADFHDPAFLEAMSERA
ncbi:hypothetical protein HXX76_008295 [Chlamydomonas incerta]|uniref:Methyltransferase small domain-containing protein n=1 Tax=Chlamydomonas incerta TaxID=51695 RepID=A0A835VZ32_CHLIN|nr:hypothetical protein HXX76_008295 [Chlamydomonas incerta]|eukprot:KAG2433225.1 hypothetical protein HXX76_008295 [Chlamydomonas incerta]